VAEMNIDLLAQLTSTPGLPGRESKVAQIIRSSLPDSSWIMHSDPLGNLIAHLPGDGKKVLLIAHMDEVGLIVRRITNDGFLLVERLGGISLRALPGARLDLWTKHGSIPAYAGILPAHLDSEQLTHLNDLYIDIGTTSQTEAENIGVRIGDGLTWSPHLEQQDSGLIVGKALDDRLGCLALLSLAGKLQVNNIPNNLYLAFVVQEETGLMGGVPVINSIAPDIVIGVDGTLAFDTPDLKDQQCDIRLGNGPTIKLMDAIRGKTGSYLPNWKLAERFRKLAEETGVPLQAEVITGLSTAITPVPFAAKGVRTVALSLPIRYHHSPIETAHVSDTAGLINLLVSFLNQPA